MEALKDDQDPPNWEVAGLGFGSRAVRVPEAGALHEDAILAHELTYGQCGNNTHWHAVSLQQICSVIVTVVVDLPFSGPGACEGVSWMGQVMMSGKILLWVTRKKLECS